MKKEYLTCAKHQKLRFKNENEFLRHVEDEHDSDVEDLLDRGRDEAVWKVAEQLSETIKVDPDEEEEEQEPTIDFEKTMREVAAGRQQTLGVERQ
jgi:hypothetical protein